MRKEQKIFDDLTSLCIQPGYAHAICWFCFRDNLVKVGEKLEAKNLENLYGYGRLVRTEISTLIGLALKGPMDLSLPAPDTFQGYIEKTETLLHEIHEAMCEPWFAHLTPEKINGGFDPFASGDSLREPIFYGGESAYGFQYRDFSVRKYQKDDEWIKKTKGFSIHTAREVVKAICDLQAAKIPRVHYSFMDLPPEDWTLLRGFEFSVEELAAHAGVSEETADSVVKAFAVPQGDTNTGFQSLSDFNIANAFPLIPTSTGSFLLFQQYNILEALYDAPYYWMTSDKRYWGKATKNRGLFTEEFCEQRLSHVFGDKDVFANVDIYESKGKRIGEIDVLVIFGNQAILLQAKSKKLTLEARKGNDLQIKDDFKKSVQDAYDQGLICAKVLGNPQYKFVPKDGRPINLCAFKEIYIFCVVSDHYPALAFQARQFLKFETNDQIAPPFVMDIFTLDALTEMLSTPLRLLSYVNRRTRYTERLLATNELTVLSYHLKYNLWLQDRYDMFTLEDNFSIDLDAAMMVRREGFSGKATPDGVLTRLSKLSLGRLITTIEREPHPATIALGFMLLTIGEDSVRNISNGIDKIVGDAQKDGEHHDFTVAVGGSDTGLTVHCNDYPKEISMARLRDYCLRRKYKQKAGTWFGVCLSSYDGELRFVVNLQNKWQFNEAMEAATRRMAAPTKMADILNKSRKKRKPGRNDPCSCGSGKKYKKCCLRKVT
ncbi:hypothetical protein HNQ81_003010 [Desulfoprunum benzoelyticum]|uniref:Preprotein translocase n=1 Tax=Desulfoprunum benzoelyticum TaxID=1506996 RepID=A0A840V355_9BACT|nr:SEC-C metal-binding domain-containing protein [Desulfoprunum benzoelyticum]MBB5349258.1 hypothetical protein [Desulfoprunum benzoelyticum]